MTKNMYSLILTDAVVERIDRLAYEKGISRSQMIDHLLAKEVGLSTPEQQTRLIVRHTADRMSAATPALQMHVRSDQGSIEVATYVKFKYNPSIKYSFDIINNQGRPFGILKVSSRSTSADLRGHLDAFLQLLVTQMQYQDPLNPGDSTEYMSQLAQYSSLEATMNISSTLDKGNALNLVGQYVIMNLKSCE